MFRDTNTLLKYHIKKNKIVKELFENLDSYSIDDINQLKVPKWIRDAAASTKKSSMIKQNDEEIINQIMQHIKIIDGFNPDIYGKIHRWMGGEIMIRIDRGGMIEMKDNRLIFFPKDGGVWIYNSVYSKFIDPRLLTSSSFIKDNVGRMDYIQMQQDELLKYNHDAPVLFSNDAARAATAKPHLASLAARGVRIG